MPKDRCRGRRARDPAAAEGGREVPARVLQERRFARADCPRRPSPARRLPLGASQRILLQFHNKLIERFSHLLAITSRAISHHRTPIATHSLDIVGPPCSIVRYWQQRMRQISARCASYLFGRQDDALPHRRSIVFRIEQSSNANANTGRSPITRQKGAVFIGENNAQVLFRFFYRDIRNGARAASRIQYLVTLISVFHYVIFQVV